MTTPTLPPLPSTIANLPQGTSPLAGNEQVPISQNGVTVRIASNQFSVVGPAGPAGATGPTGPQGPTGPSGGVANINAGLINNLAYYAAAGQTLSPIATANSGLLVTSAAGVPSISSTIPNGVVSTTQSAADSTTKLATTAFVNGTALTLAAGTTAVTQSPGDNSTKVATTAFVTTNTPSGIRGNTYQVTDSTDITLSQAPTQANIGSTKSITVPTKGMIQLYFTGRVIFSTNQNDLILGIRIGSTNYWPQDTSNSDYLSSNFVAIAVTTTNNGWGGNSEAGSGAFIGPSGLSVDALSIPTGTQTIQVIASRAYSNAAQIKGTAITSIINIVTIDCS